MRKRLNRHGDSMRPGEHINKPKDKVKKRLESNQILLNTLSPKEEKERFYPVKRERTWKFIKGINKWVSKIVPDEGYKKTTRFIKSSDRLPRVVT